jgi:hypothetical protein
LQDAQKCINLAPNFAKGAASVCNKDKQIKNTNKNKISFWAKVHPLSVRLRLCAMCVYEYICMYVCMYVCIYTQTHIHTHTHTHTHTHIHIYVVCVCLLASASAWDLCTHIHLYTQATCACIHLYLYTHLYIGHTYIQLRIYTCRNTYVYSPMYTYIHPYQAARGAITHDNKTNTCIICICIYTHI